MGSTPSLFFAVRVDKVVLMSSQVFFLRLPNRSFGIYMCDKEGLNDCQYSTVTVKLWQLTSH